MGDSTANVTFQVRCEKYAALDNGTVVLLEPDVDAGAIDTDPNTANSCIDSLLPAGRTQPCADRSCEVLEVQSQFIGNCFSTKQLPCGQKKILKKSSCHSKTAGDDITNVTQLEGTLCEGRVGLMLEDCTEPVEACPSGAFHKYGSWSACSSTCPATWPANCANGNKCQIPGVRNRTVQCIELSANGTQTISTACTESTEATAGTCETACYRQPVYLRQSVGECSATCDSTGTQPVTYAACEPGASGCAVFPGVNSAATTGSLPCAGAPCNPCANSKCIASNTVEKIASGGSCRCICAEGFSGSRCHIDSASSKPLPLLDASGRGCNSGILDVRGVCCTPPSNDGLTGGLDNCGYCRGTSVTGLGPVRAGYALDGSCCSGEEGVLLTGDYSCCASRSLLDECALHSLAGSSQCSVHGGDDSS